MRLIAQRIEKRLVAETTPERAVRLMQAAVNLANLRIERSELRNVFRGDGLMKTGYDELLEDLIKQTQKILLKQGAKRFGAPTSMQESSLRSIEDLDRLERMTLAVLNAKDWEDLLSTW